MLRKTLFLFALTIFSSMSFGQSKTQELVDKGLDRLGDNQSTQKALDESYDSRKKAESKYLSELKILQGLNMYNDMLKQQLDDQDEQIAKLNNSINNATLVERQIMPLLVRMVDALEVFVNVDVPFLLEERVNRVQNLRDLLKKAEYTTSEKCRRVFEAYQIENEFGYTIESYKGRVEVESQQIAVDFLRIGRIALLYRDISGERVGFWNKETEQWQPLTEQMYLRHITKGLKIAKEEISPELITIPLLGKVEVRS